MDRRIWAIVIVIVAVCAVLIAWLAVQTQASRTAWESTTFTYREPDRTRFVVGVMIAATILAAVAVGFWTARRPK